MFKSHGFRGTEYGCEWPDDWGTRYIDDGYIIVQRGCPMSRLLAASPEMLRRINLAMLHLGPDCNAPLVKLPCVTSELSFGASFNQPLGTVIRECCPELGVLHFDGGAFNQPISADALPPVRELALGCSYDQQLPPLPTLNTLRHAGRVVWAELPFSRASLLRELVLTGRIAADDAPLDGSSLPPGLGTLVLAGDFNGPVAGATFGELKRLELSGRFNRPLAPGVLPAFLDTLALGGDFNQPLAPGVLPAGLTRLYLYGAFNQPLEPGALPPALVRLVLGDAFDQPISVDALPRGLRYLRIGDAFNRPLTGPARDAASLRGAPSVSVGPATLRRLVLGAAFNQPLERVLSDMRQLTCVALGASFNQPLARRIARGGVCGVHRMVRFLPPTVTELTLGAGFRQPLAAGALPPGMRHLRFLGEPVTPLERICKGMKQLDCLAVAAYTRPIRPGALRRAPCIGASPAANRDELGPLKAPVLCCAFPFDDEELSAQMVGQDPVI